MYKYIGRHIPKQPETFFSHFRTMSLREEVKKGKGTSNLMEFAKWTKLYLKPY